LSMGSLMRIGSCVCCCIERRFFFLIILLCISSDRVLFLSSHYYVMTVLHIVPGGSSEFWFKRDSDPILLFSVFCFGCLGLVALDSGQWIVHLSMFM